MAGLLNNGPMEALITGISSMATRAVLAELAAEHQRRAGVQVRIESVGGVDAVRRVQAGERFDCVLLAADALQRLVGSGHALADSRVDLMRSPVAVAVRAGAPRPDLGTADAVRRALLAAPRIGYSTGPSGVQLLQLIDGWGLGEALRSRLVQAPVGISVGQLVADGAVDIGLQQLSELMNLAGVDVVGTLPEPIAIVTTFSAALCPGATHPADAQALLAWMASAETAETKRRHGMQPA